MHLKRRGRDTRDSPHTCTEKRSCEDTARRCCQPAGKSALCQELNLPAPPSWTSSLQKCEKNECCLNHPVSGILHGSPSRLMQMETFPKGLLRTGDFFIMYRRFYDIRMEIIIILGFKIINNYKYGIKERGRIDNFTR